jgi:hypothetical protein
MIRQSAGKSYAYILGVYLGDGCISNTVTSADSQNKRTFRLNTIDEDFALATKEALIDLGAVIVPIRKHDVKNGRPNHALQCVVDDFGITLQSDTFNKTVIPRYVLEWSRENKLAFITGLMDSEGFVAANSGNPTNRRYYMGFKSTDVWVADFVRILESVGIKVGVVSTEEPRQPHYRRPTRFTIKMQSWIDSGAKFNIARKQNRVDAWAAIGAYEQRSRHPRRLSSETNM